MNPTETQLGTPRNPARRRQIMRTALLLAGIALTFYIGFIVIGVMRS